MKQVGIWNGVHVLLFSMYYDSHNDKIMYTAVIAYMHMLTIRDEVIKCMAMSYWCLNNYTSKYRIAHM